MTLLKKSVNCVTCEECNLKSPLFRHLTEDELDLMNNNRYEVKFKAGEIIFKQGVAWSHIISLNTGLAKIYIEGFDNKNLLLRIVKPTEVLGGPGIYVDNRHHFSLAALEPSTACFIDINVFKDIMHQNCQFAEAFIKTMSENQIYIFERLLSLTQKKMHGRIADALLYLSNDIYNKNPFATTLTKQELGELTGMTKESACRILKEFHTDGIIKANGKSIEVLNLKSLKNISEMG